MFKASMEMLVSMAKIGTLKRVNIDVIFIDSLSLSLKIVQYRYDNTNGFIFQIRCSLPVFIAAS